MSKRSVNFGRGRGSQLRPGDFDRVLAFVEGRCGQCGELVAGWKPPVGSFAPEAWAALRDRGIDPTSGHKKNCTRYSPSTRTKGHR